MKSRKGLEAILKRRSIPHDAALEILAYVCDEEKPAADAPAADAPAADAPAADAPAA